ncbi:MAG: DNA repair and recombination protein RadB [Candidatus Diapherotrites archaeon]|nr:DNA repair and recombination protein RadB [Candidatus Diapherotrites archaeon]
MIENIPLNCPIDDLLGGGLPSRLITQVYGPAGSGKSNLALQASINATRMGGKVLFVDPEGSFNLKRLEQMQPSKEALKSIVLREPASMSEQAEAIDVAWGIDGLALVVVDSIIYHFRLELDRDEPHKANKELGLQTAALLDIARKKNIPVLVTNQVYTNPDTGRVEPTGGDTLRYGSKAIVELSHSSDRHARLVKHPFMKDGQRVSFKIVGKGVI